MYAKHDYSQKLQAGRSNEAGRGCLGGRESQHAQQLSALCRAPGFSFDARLSVRLYTDAKYASRRQQYT